MSESVEKNTEGFKVCISKVGSVSEAERPRWERERPQRLSVESVSWRGESGSVCYLLFWDSFPGTKERGGHHAIHHLHHGQEDHLDQGLVRLPPVVWCGVQRGHGVHSETRKKYRKGQCRRKRISFIWLRIFLTSLQYPVRNQITICLVFIIRFIGKGISLHKERWQSRRMRRKLTHEMNGHDANFTF